MLARSFKIVLRAHIQESWTITQYVIATGEFQFQFQWELIECSKSQERDNILREK